jgi:cytochrome oxidase Cu insertion factor (SCO1/SenC/PrrC family)
MVRLQGQLGGYMKRAFLKVLRCVAALGFTATAAWAQRPPIPGQAEVNIGDTAPDFTLQASDGQTYTLSKLRGRTIVLAWFPKAFTTG